MTYIELPHGGQLPALESLIGALHWRRLIGTATAYRLIRFARRRVLITPGRLYFWGYLAVRRGWISNRALRRLCYWLDHAGLYRNYRRRLRGF